MAQKKKQGKARKPVKKPTKRKVYRLRGRFVSRETWEQAQKLQKQAREEKKAKPKPTLGAHVKRGNAFSLDGKRIKETDKRSALDRVRGSKARTERQLSFLDFGSIPPPDVIREYPDPSDSSRIIYRYEWRFEDLLGESLARDIVKRLGVYSIENDVEILTRVSVTRIWYDENNKRHVDSISTRAGLAQRTIKNLNDLEDTKSISAHSVFDDEGETEELWFDVYALVKRKLDLGELTNGNVDTEGRRNKKLGSRKQRTRKTAEVARGKRITTPRGGKTRKGSVAKTRKTQKSKRGKRKG